MKKITRMISVLLSATMLFSLITGSNFFVFAQKHTNAFFEYDVLGDGTVEIIRYSGNDAEVTIPSEMDGRIVTAIAENAFYYRWDLTSLTIPAGVKSIDAFAIQNCDKLENINVDFNNKHYASQNGVLFNKDRTELVRYPEGKSETAYVIPDTVTSIGNSAFRGCDRLPGITMPDGVTSIGEYAFYYCQNLKNITIPDGVTSIGEYAFSNCICLTSIKIPDGVTSIGRSTFSECRRLTSIEIPNGVTSIGDFAFYYCVDLKNITIPDSVTGIGKSAFDSCRDLTSITIPDSVMSIGESAFDDTGYYNDQSNWENGVLYINNALIKANCNIIDESCNIKNGITMIASCAFLNCNRLVNIIIPDSVIFIGNRAFESCENLVSVIIPDSVTIIGDSAFESCNVLSNVILSNNLTSIGVCTFGNCWEIREIIIPNSVISIGDNAFHDCYGLESIEIPNSVTSIYKRAFSWCTNLKSINVNDNNLNYSSIDGVLYNRDKTKLVSYPAGKPNKEFIIPNSVMYICDYAFNYCESLSNIIIPDSVISIGEFAFTNCNGIQHINIPNSVTSIGNYAFFESDNLEYILFLGTRDQWSSISFGDRFPNVKIYYKNDSAEFIFYDLKGFDIYKDYVFYTSVYNKFIAGTDPPYYTEFSPTKPITRAMLIAILYRMAGNPYDDENPHKTNPFSDVKENAYYYNAACWALDEGITNQTTFKPFDNVTREQTARFLFAYAEAKDMLGDENYKNVNLRTYPDYDSVHSWAVEPLQWANYNDMITGTSQGYINPQGATQRIHATRILYGFGKVCNIGNFE